MKWVFLVARLLFALYIIFGFANYLAVANELEAKIKEFKSVNAGKGYAGYFCKVIFGFILLWPVPKFNKKNIKSL